MTSLAYLLATKLSRKKSTMEMPTMEIFHKHNADDISVSKDHGRHVILLFPNLPQKWQSTVAADMKSFRQSSEPAGASEVEIWHIYDVLLLNSTTITCCWWFYNIFGVFITFSIDNSWVCGFKWEIQAEIEGYPWAMTQFHPTVSCVLCVYLTRWLSTTLKRK